MYDVWRWQEDDRLRVILESWQAPGPKTNVKTRRAKPGSCRPPRPRTKRNSHCGFTEPCPREPLSMLATQTTAANRTNTHRTLAHPPIRASSPSLCPVKPTRPAAGWLVPFRSGLSDLTPQQAGVRSGTPPPHSTSRSQGQRTETKVKIKNQSQVQSHNQHTGADERPRVAMNATATASTVELPRQEPTVSRWPSAVTVTRRTRPAKTRLTDVQA